MSYILRYSVTRRHVWNWYWRRWIKGAWVRQFFVALAITAYSAFASHLSIAGSFALFFVALLVVVVVFAAWPQFAFKPQERVLEVNSKGWSTQIGNKTGSKTWSDVASVQAEHGITVITSRSGNALLVPASAFADASEQRRFFEETQAWQQGHAV